MNNKAFSLSLTMAGLLACATAQASCGSAFCSINTNWDEHSLGHQGWSAGLRYSYSHADTLRSGSDTIKADTSADGEVENMGTYNNIVTGTVDYTYNNNWGVMVAVPFIDRKHQHHVGPYTGSSPAGTETFHATALGDTQLIGRFRWSLGEESHSGLGLKFGIKLPTGSQDVTMDGEVPEEASLQPGSGSTDAILGLFWHHATPGSAWSWFAQGSVQTPALSKDSYKPGTQVKADLGTRYALSRKMSVLMQINSQLNTTDSGDGAALTEDGDASSGGRTISLSPGLSYAFIHSAQIYALVQVPVYQYVNGEQLTPSYSVSSGISYRF